MLIRLVLILTIAIIFSLGLVMIFSTTSAEVLDLDLNKSTYHSLLKQISYAIGGMILALGIWKIGYQRLLSLSPILLFIFTIFLVMVLVPGIGREVNGSKRWLSIAGFSFQPSEFVKYLVPAYFIHRFLQFQGKELSFRDFIKLVAVVAIPMFLIIIEPNNGTTGVIGLTLVVLFALTRIQFKYWALPLLISIIIGGISAYNLHYVSARIKVYLNPELDLKGKGHQPYQAKIAAGSGKIFGKGPGNSLQKLSYLPEAQNDYIAAIYAEEFGFIGLLLLIALYMTVACCGTYVAYHAADREGFYYAGAITFLICFQAFLNLGVVSGLLPSTGLNLPFFSQGGSSLMANMIGITLLIQIATESKRAHDSLSLG